MTRDTSEDEDERLNLIENETARQRQALRDEMAAAALIGLLALHGKHDGQYSQTDRAAGTPAVEAAWIAGAAYRYADAMMEARRHPSEN